MQSFRRWYGVTSIDAVTTAAAIFFLLALTALVVGPAHRLRERRDEQRVNGVRNIMEAILEMQTVDPERVDAFRAAAEAAGAPPRVMLGNGATCAGDFGVQCGDALLADTCLDFSSFAQEYLPQVPVDAAAGFSAAATGYYIDFSPGILEVGACNPETRNDIRLERTFF